MKKLYCISTVERSKSSACEAAHPTEAHRVYNQTTQAQRTLDQRRRPNFVSHSTEKSMKTIEDQVDTQNIRA